MAAIAPIEGSVQGPFTATGTVLSADDTITFDAKRRQLLVLNNPTGGALTATIDGDGGTSVVAPGVGSVSVSAGLAIAVPAGQSRAVQLATVSAYCQGVVHLTGGAGLTAQLINL
jgi:hypothetical protein